MREAMSFAVIGSASVWWGGSWPGNGGGASSAVVKPSRGKGQKSRASGSIWWMRRSTLS